jgi:hypothetical protein
MTRLEASAIKLRFVPLDRLLVHEETDPFRVKRLMLALDRDGKLRNPPIVTKHGDYFIVLDGATRTTALREMGLLHALVQIVDAKEGNVELRSWYHVISGLSSHRFLGNLAGIELLPLQPVAEETGRNWLPEGDIVARIVLRDGREFGVVCTGDLNCQTDHLCQLVATYRGKAEVHRSATLNLTSLITQYPNLTAAIAFPLFTPSEIVHIAINGSKAPMGVTRHIISGRALGLGVPLEMLTNSQSLKAKNNWLSDLFHQRLQANKIRIYEEPVFVFDD